VEHASAFEDTLTRIRQRYALHFNLPEGAKSGVDANIEVGVTASAKRRYGASEVRYRRMNQFGVTTSDPVVVSSTAGPEKTPESSRGSELPQRNDERSRGGWRRVDDPNSDRPVGPRVAVAQPPAAQDNRPTTAPPPAIDPAPAPEEKQPKKGGWRRVKPGEEP
jgi:hypothetical protein